MKTIFILGLCFTLAFINSREITFRMDRKVDLSQSNPEIISELSKNNFFAYINMGTKQKEMKVEIQSDTHSFGIYKDNFNGVKTVIPYQQSDSELLFVTPATFQSEYGKGFISYDLLNYGEGKAKYGFPYIGGVSNHFPMESGFIGLGICPNSQRLSEDTSFIHELNVQQMINSYYFSIKYNDLNNAELTVGEEINPKDILKLPSVSVDSKNKWSLMFDDVFNGNKRITKYTPSIIASISIGQTMFIGTKAYDESVFINFFEEYIKNNLCRKISYSGFYTYICSADKVNYSQFKTLSFYIEDEDISFDFDYKDLFLEVGKNEKIFLVKFQNTKEDLKDGLWGFGDIFIKKYNAKFNIKKRFIGIPKTKINFKASVFWMTGTKKENVLISIIAAMTILIAVGMLYYTLKLRSLTKPTQKKIVEVEMEDDLVDESQKKDIFKNYY